MSSLSNRMIRAASLDGSVYEEVEADEGATGQAMVVVVLSSVAAGIGAWQLGLTGLIVAALGALIGWFIWAILIYFVGTTLLPEATTKATPGELLRTLGFAASPGVLRVIGFIPLLGWLVSFIVSIWMLITMVIAVKRALDYQSTLRAIVVCLIGWVVYSVFLGVVFLIF